MDSLKASVLTAFYTPQAITDTIADVLHDRKVRPKLVLEPSAGMARSSARFFRTTRRRR